MKKPSEILQEIEDKVKDKTCDNCLFVSCGSVGKAMVITEGGSIGILEDASYPVCHAWEPKTSKNYSPLDKRQYLWKLSMAIYLEKIFDDIAAGVNRHEDLSGLLSNDQGFPKIGAWDRGGDVIKEFFDLDNLPEAVVKELLIAGVVNEKATQPAEEIN